MNNKQWEIHSAYGGLSAGDLGRIMGDRGLNPFTQAELLAAALAMPFKETGRAHYRALIEDEQGRRAYDQDQIARGVSWLERLGLSPSPFDAFDLLPRYSFALDLRFTLARPYLSRDDDAFYIIDNPVRKDKVFKVPLVAPTSWKGALRASATRGLLDEWRGLLPDSPPQGKAERKALLDPLCESRARRVMIFGNEKKKDADYLNRWLVSRLYRPQPDQDGKTRHRYLHRRAKALGRCFEAYLVSEAYRTERVEGRQGRLFCFPTFFDRIGLEIINPHDRERRVGKNPILFECVPAGASGEFRLLYVPYDLSSQVTPDEAVLRGQVREHLPLVAQAVADTLAVYGFGAKTSSGYGTADPVAQKVKLGLNLMVEQESPEAQHYRAMQAEVDKFVEKYKLPEFPYWDQEELAASDWGRKRQSDYKRLRDQHPDWDAETRQWHQPAPPPEQERHPLMIEEESLGLDKLPQAVGQLLTQTGGAA